jgi:hypothetical protein
VENIITEDEFKLEGGEYKLVGDESNLGRDELNLGKDENNLGRDENNLGRDENNLGRDENNLGRDEFKLGRDENNLGRVEFKLVIYFYFLYKSIIYVKTSSEQPYQMPLTHSVFLQGSSSGSFHCIGDVLNVGCIHEWIWAVVVQS